MIQARLIAANAGVDFIRLTVPGKEEFHETIRYFHRQLQLHEVELRLQTTATVDELVRFEEVVLASGVKPRQWQWPPDYDSRIMSYTEALQLKEKLNGTVAIIGGGGIGFDVASALVHSDDTDFYEQWGIDTELEQRGGVKAPKPHASDVSLHMFQRSSGKMGAHLGKTTGWIHRLELKKAGVHMHTGVTYNNLDKAGLHYTEGGEDKLLQADHFIVCAGQVAYAPLHDQLTAAGIHVHRIGGALNAKKLDAQRAIKEGLELAYRID